MKQPVPEYENLANVQVAAAARPIRTTMIEPLDHELRASIQMNSNSKFQQRSASVPISNTAAVVERPAIVSYVEKPYVSNTIKDSASQQRLPAKNTAVS